MREVPAKENEIWGNGEINVNYREEDGKYYTVGKLYPKKDKLMFEYLEQNYLLQEAMEEREKAIELWIEIQEDFKRIQLPDSNLKEFIENSIEYAIRFFTITKINFHIFEACRKPENMNELLKEYDETWAYSKELEERPQASISYCEQYIFSEDNKGLDETIVYCRETMKF